MARSVKRKPREHVGQWIKVDGQPVHVLADPDMSPELRTALEEMVRCAIKAIGEGTLPKKRRDGGRDGT